MAKDVKKLGTLLIMMIPFSVFAEDLPLETCDEAYRLNNINNINYEIDADQYNQKREDCEKLQGAWASKLREVKVEGKKLTRAIDVNNRFVKSCCACLSKYCGFRYQACIDGGYQGWDFASDWRNIPRCGYRKCGNDCAPGSDYNSKLEQDISDAQSEFDQHISEIKEIKNTWHQCESEAADLGNALHSALSSFNQELKTFTKPYGKSLEEIVGQCEDEAEARVKAEQEAEAARVKAEAEARVKAEQEAEAEAARVKAEQKREQCYRDCETKFKCQIINGICRKQLHRCLKNCYTNQESEKRARWQALPDTLGEKIVLSGIKRGLPNITTCAQEQVNRDKNKVIKKIVLGFTIHNDGRCSSITIEPETLKGSYFENCVKREVVGWDYPMFFGETIKVKVDLPLAVR